MTQLGSPITYLRTTNSLLILLAQYLTTHNQCPIFKLCTSIPTVWNFGTFSQSMLMKLVSTFSKPSGLAHVPLV